MIKLRGKHTTQSDDSNKIVFEPRPEYSKNTKELVFPLIYGHHCPYCSNVMQALFKAPRMFSLWEYEETTLLSQGSKNSGEIRKVYPDNKVKKGKSCYRMDFNPVEGGSVKITLKNHIMRHSAISKRTYDGENIWETGEKPCTWAGIFSTREDLLVKDWLLFSQLGDGTQINGDSEISKYDLPTIDKIVQEDDKSFKLIPSVGAAPPVILVDRHDIAYGFHYATRTKIAQYRK